MQQFIIRKSLSSLIAFLMWWSVKLLYLTPSCLVQTKLEGIGHVTFIIVYKVDEIGSFVTEDYFRIAFDSNLMYNKLSLKNLLVWG